MLAEAVISLRSMLELASDESRMHSQDLGETEHVTFREERSLTRYETVHFLRRDTKILSSRVR
jgi:hypothetical protein